MMMMMMILLGIQTRSARQQLIQRVAWTLWDSRASILFRRWCDAIDNQCAKYGGSGGIRPPKTLQITVRLMSSLQRLSESGVGPEYGPLDGGPRAWALPRMTISNPQKYFPTFPISHTVAHFCSLHLLWSLASAHCSACTRRLWAAQFGCSCLLFARRTNKSPLIFAAKTDREMREWMMAIKLLAEKLTSDRTPVTAPIGGVMTPTRGVATRRASQQPSPHLLHVSRRDDVTRRSSPQLQTISSPALRWSAGQCHV